MCLAKERQMLKEIIKNKHGELMEQKKQRPPEQVQEEASFSPLPHDFKKALQGKPGQVKVIGEIKKASPSHGIFDSVFLKENSIPEMARIYERAGVSAISVLTDKKYFAGSPEDLKKVKSVAGVPVLRKDFIVDEYQVYESRAMGADAVLLIVSVLSLTVLKRMVNLVHELKMHALVEAGDERDIDRALEAGAEIIGINNRNLRTMQVELNRTINLAKYIPGGCILVSESGIDSWEQVRMLNEQAGINAVLVGKSLVTAEDPYKKIRNLIEGE